MKSFFLIISFLFAVNSISFAQPPVTDTHPTATIFAIDYASGQEAPATSGDAILFKDALIELVSNTTTSKMLAKLTPGHKTFVITQMNPETNGYAYQLVLESKFLGQTSTVYTFLFNVDQNTLFYFSPQQQNWLPENIQGYNVNNLNNALAYSKFNTPAPQETTDQAAAPDQSAQPVVDADADNTTPVDADVSVKVVPPDMPDYQQPECPQDGYLWQPGYWAYSLDTNGYYWVPGVWVAPPNAGLLWTPPYWGFDGGLYVFHTGYWGNTIGFYGGINYGYGYGGVGYGGGEWREGHFRYNTAVVRVNTTIIHNTYVDRTVIVNRSASHSSFNGRGGVMARPNAHEVAAMHEHHINATSDQIRNQRIARSDKSQFASSNGGKPANLTAEKIPARNPNNNNNNMKPGNAGQAGGRQGATGVTDNKTGGQAGGRQGAPGVTDNRAGAPTGAPRTGAPHTATAARPGMPQVPSAPGVPGARSGGAGGRSNIPGKMNSPGKSRAPKTEAPKKDKKS